MHPDLQTLHHHAVQNCNQTQQAAKWDVLYAELPVLATAMFFLPFSKHDQQTK